jgi:hypothetical protein
MDRSVDAKLFRILSSGVDPMRPAAIIVTLSLLIVPAWAADVYRSVDAQGNIVYSDRPGDEGAVRVVIAATAARAPVSVANSGTAAAQNSPAEPDAATIAAAERAQLAEDRAANCAIARQRNETYATSHRLYRVAEDGERVYFSDTELSQARMDAQTEVARWCG